MFLLADILPIGSYNLPRANQLSNALMKEVFSIID